MLAPDASVAAIDPSLVCEPRIASGLPLVCQWPKKTFLDTALPRQLDPGRTGIGVARSWGIAKRRLVRQRSTLNLFAVLMQSLQRCGQKGGASCKYSVKKEAGGQGVDVNQLDTTVAWRAKEPPFDAYPAFEVLPHPRALTVFPCQVSVIIA